MGKRVKKSMPAIFCDIDGVVLQGAGGAPKLIGNSKKIIRKVLKPVKNGLKVPFTFLTNGGGYSE
jgi:ribonucleotide monophosphatase NagD (HAD superfamily)